MEKQTDVNEKMRAILDDRLAGRGAPQVQADGRDALPDRQPDRSLPREGVDHAQQAAARWCDRHVHRFQVRGDLRARVPRLRLHLGQG
eukprot:7302786-Prymnesium_polylepis.1